MFQSSPNTTPLLNHFQIAQYFVPQLHLKLSFKQLRTFTVQQLTSQTCPQLLSQAYLSKHKKDLAKRVFELQVKSQYQTWTIMKRIEDFISLEKTLKDRFGKKVMGIPVRKESDNENSLLLLQFFELFLQQISKHEDIKRDVDYLLFIELPVNEERRRLKIYKQEFMKKRSGGRHNQATCRRCTSTIFGNWKRRLFAVTSQGIFYSIGHQPQNSQVKQMVPFSFHFSIVYGLRDTGFQHGIVLNSCQRTLQLIADHVFSFVSFIHAVKKSLADNHYLEVNRYGSFASVRENCDAKAYVDGEEYFGDIYHELQRARKEVFITDWMLTPFFMLVRNQKEHKEEGRLDRVLERAAKRGVRINIILFLQPKMALNNDSEYAKQYLESLHPNIKVLRHPNYILIPFLWSHHEKIVIIDQKTGFLGGLDLCYGRWDTPAHKLIDPEQLWIGADYANFRISDIYTPREYQTSMLDRQKVPRMPWHDIAVQIRGDSVIDLTRHFVQYWNFVNFQTKFNDRELLMQAGLTSTEHNYDQKMTIERCREEVRRFQGGDEARKEEEAGNLVEKEGKQPHEENRWRNRSVTDNAFLIDNQVRKKAETYARKDRTISFSLDEQIRGLQNIAVEDSTQKQFYREFLARESLNRQQVPLIRNINEKIAEKLKKLKNIKLNPMELFKQRQALTNDIMVEGEAGSKGKQRHQILRSASTWGLGIEEGNEQKSIYNAYIELITQAKEFIYIQNQFFISVENKISQAISLRIDKAYRDHQPFKIIVILPLLPGFQGQIDNQNSAVLRVQMHLQYQTICRGGQSLFQRLSHIQNLSDYIHFYCLRTHDKLDGQPVTEIVYVHSKLMIVDDEVVVMGSANINDRSMLGTRDSEIAIVIEDGEQVTVKRGEGNVKVKKFAHELRVKLYMEHFQVTKQQAEDYLNQDVWWLINQRAKKNTIMYRQIFACYPDNQAKDLFQYKVFQKGKKYQRYDLLRELITGNVVEFPTCFMSNQRLSLKASQKQFYVPAISFT